MYPPYATPLISRVWTAVTKVTTLTDPYAAAIAAAFKCVVIRFKMKKPETGTTSAITSPAAMLETSRRSRSEPASAAPPFSPIAMSR
jgi:hypothetical protein